MGKQFCVKCVLYLIFRKRKLSCSLLEAKEETRWAIWEARYSLECKELRDKNRWSKDLEKEIH